MKKTMLLPTLSGRIVYNIFFLHFFSINKKIYLQFILGYVHFKGSQYSPLSVVLTHVKLRAHWQIFHFQMTQYSPLSVVLTHVKLGAHWHVFHFEAVFVSPPHDGSHPGEESVVQHTGFVYRHFSR